MVRQYFDDRPYSYAEGGRFESGRGKKVVYRESKSKDYDIKEFTDIAIKKYSNQYDEETIKKEINSNKDWYEYSNDTFLNRDLKTLLDNLRILEIGKKKIKHINKKLKINDTFNIEYSIFFNDEEDTDNPDTLNEPSGYYLEFTTDELKDSNEVDEDVFNIDKNITISYDDDITSFVMPLFETKSETPTNYKRAIKEGKNKIPVLTECFVKFLDKLTNLYYMEDEDDYAEGGKVGAVSKTKIQITDGEEGRKIATRTLIKENKNGERITYELLVGVFKDKKKGYFEIYATDSDDDEYFYAEGGLWIEGGRVVDYDGVYELSEKLKPLMSALNLNSVDVFAEGGETDDDDNDDDDNDDDDYAEGGKTGEKSTKKRTIKKRPKTREPKMVRQYFDDRPYSYAKGGKAEKKYYWIKMDREKIDEYIKYASRMVGMFEGEIYTQAPNKVAFDTEDDMFAFTSMIENHNNDNDFQEGDEGYIYYEELYNGIPRPNIFDRIIGDKFAEGGKTGMIHYYIGGLVSEDIPFVYNGEEEDINYEVGFHEGGIDLESFNETPSGYYVRIIPYGSTEIRRFVYPEKDIEIAYLSELRAITMLLFEADKDTKENQKIAIKEGKKNLPKLLKYMNENVEEEDKFRKNVRKVQDEMWGGDEDEDEEGFAEGGEVDILGLYKKDIFSEKDYELIDEAIENGDIDTTNIKEDFIGYVYDRIDEEYKDNKFEDEQIWEYTDEYYENGLPHKENYKKLISYLNNEDEEGFAEGGEVSDWMEQALDSLIKETGNEDLDITMVSNNGNEFFAGNDMEEYRVFKTEEDAEQEAIEQVRDDLQESPENFNQDFIKNYIDGRDFFEAELNEMNYMYVEDISSETSGTKYNNRLIDELVENGLMDEDDAILENAEEIADELKYDYVLLLTEEKLDDGNDGLDYFINNFGENETYGMVVDNNLIDIDKASQDAVDIDGIAHFISSYDGRTLYLLNNNVAYRNN